MSGTRRAALLLCFAALLVAPVGCGSGEPAVLRYDGLYRAGPFTTDHTTYWRYLRFYEDGTVLSMSSTGEPDAIQAALTKSHENAGQWTREDDRITFSCQGGAGRVDYEGEVLEDALELSFHSHINDRRGENRYELVPLETPANDP